MRRLFLLIFFFTLVPIGIILGLVTGGAIPQITNPLSTQQVIASNTQFYASLPENYGHSQANIIAGDARILILEQYLESFNSPLASASASLVEAADQYDLDFRLLAAISRQESAGCKIIPPGSHNCWGWGIHSRGTLHFESLEHGIFTVSKGLRENYLNQGLVTPEQIMSKYTPSSPGTWSFAVETFMNDME